MGIVASFVVDNPGDVTMLWFNYQIETSIAFMIAAITIAVIILMSFILLIRRILYAPSNFINKRTTKHLKSGLNELTHTIAALATSNIDSAEKHIHKAERLIGKTPLTLLLEAQISKSKGNEVKTQKLLESLLEYKETEFLAARSLSDNANKHENLPAALKFAKKAQSLEPKNNHSSLAVISLQTRMQQWDEALANVMKAKLKRKDKKRIAALIKLMRAQSLLNNGNNEQALIIAEEASPILSNFTPATTIMANIYSKNDNNKKAISILTKALKRQPSSYLMETLQNIIESEPEEYKKKILEKFSDKIKNGKWICSACSHSHEKWGSHCASCSSFDTLEWVYN